MLVEDSITAARPVRVDRFSMGRSSLGFVYG